jgi:hypothetical protein
MHIALWPGAAPPVRDSMPGSGAASPGAAGVPAVPAIAR